VQDSTIQRLAKLCEVRPRGMMQIRDELSGLFAGMARQSGARGFLLECWNGEKHIVERVDTKQSLTVPNLLVGIIGGFQPDKLARAFSGDEDGMYARFLFAWPATPAYAPLSDAIGEIDLVFQGMLTKLIRLPDEDASGQFAPRIIPLSRDARDRFEEYRVWVDGVKRGLDGREQQWLVKSESQVLRLANTLTYLDWASLGDESGTGVGRISAGMEPDEVPESCMVAATRLLCEYFWPHARAALRQIGLTDRHRHLRRALRWIKANGRTEVSLKDIRREAFGGALGAEQTRDLLDRLVTAGWLRSEKTDTGGAPVGALAHKSKNFLDRKNCHNCKKPPVTRRFGTFCSYWGLCSLNNPEREGLIRRPQGLTHRCQGRRRIGEAARRSALALDRGRTGRSQDRNRAVAFRARGPRPCGDGTDRWRRSSKLRGFVDDVVVIIEHRDGELASRRRRRSGRPP
jgi:hypothetical protein